MALLPVSIGKLARAGFGNNKWALEQPRLLEGQGGCVRQDGSDNLRMRPVRSPVRIFKPVTTMVWIQLMSSHRYPSVIGPSSFQWKSSNCNDFIQSPSVGRDGQWEAGVLSHLKAARLTWDPEPHSIRYKRMKQSAQPKGVYGKALIHSQKGSHDFWQHTATQPVHLLDPW